jgi:membrane protein DedA with SNARE-associated domain
VAESRFSFSAVIIISTIASIVGSLLSYGIGRYGGRPFIDRFGKYLLLNEYDLAVTEKFFAKYGDITILICRFIPVIRHLISIPAGTGRMNLLKFSLYTVIGAGLWNAFLTVCGFYLRKNWEAVMEYSRIVDIAVLLILIGLVVLFIATHIKRARRRGGD